MSSPVPKPNEISTETIALLHPEAITRRPAIADLISGWSLSKTPLRRGTNHAGKPEIATIVEIDHGTAVLECLNFEGIELVLFLSTEYQGIPYFCSFSVTALRKKKGPMQQVSVLSPGVIYRAERRDRARDSVSDQERLVALVRESGERCNARLVDISADGMGVAIPLNEDVQLGEAFRIQERGSGSQKLAIARNSWTENPASQWRRVGLSLLPASPSSRLSPIPAAKLLKDLGGLAETSHPRALREEPAIVRFQDPNGEEIVGILDHSGDSKGAPAILIPSAWGKTKETLAGLAATILATFSEAGQPISVLRIDGIRKRGESHNDPECQLPYLQNLNYTFTQGSRDLLAAAHFLQASRAAGPIVIVSLSVASVEARRAIVVDNGKRFAGWISVVGATDPQSLIRIISGGVDYLAGAERGLQFGRQDIQGMLLNIDRTAEEALGNKIAFLDDARRDFASIQCPVTWLSGSNDAWTDPRRIDDVLSFGLPENRRLIRSESGHQLKNSREALETFGIVASECSRMLFAAPPLRPVRADRNSLRKRQLAERRRLRLPDVEVDLRSFWRDYLVGRDLNLGMELVTETSSYRDLMCEQIEKLDLAEDQMIVDLGSGVGTFERSLRNFNPNPTRLRIISIDFVHEAVKRGQFESDSSSQLQVSHVVADLGLASASWFPIQYGSADRALGSLLLNYLPEPKRFLSETYFLLRPGGHLVLSVLRKDADTSKICVDGIAELRSGQALTSFGQNRESKVDSSLGGFINDAARLLDLEEQGIFRFWDRDELVSTLRDVGFINIAVREAFGHPPQAWLATAVRPE